MAEIPAAILVHTVTVEKFEGHGARGPVYADPVTVPCFVSDTRKLVRGPDGQQVVAESTVLAAPASLGEFSPESRVTLPSGRVGTVLVVKDHNDGGLGAPQHVEVAIT